MQELVMPQRHALADNNCKTIKDLFPEEADTPAGPGRLTGCLLMLPGTMRKQEFPERISQSNLEPDIQPGSVLIADVKK
jgi:hypothetical protein